MSHPSRIRASRASVAAIRLVCFNADDLVADICKAHGVRASDVTSSLRGRRLVNARAEVIQALYVELGWSPSAIAYVTTLSTRTVADALAKPAKKAKAA